MESITSSDKANNFDKNLGARLRLQRVSRGLTQKQLAAKLGISFQQVQKYETGINKISAERLWRLSQLFSVSISYWMGGSETEQPPATLFASSNTERRMVQLVQYYSGIPDETVKTLLFAFTRALSQNGGAQPAAAP